MHSRRAAPAQTGGPARRGLTFGILGLAWLTGISAARAQELDAAEILERAAQVQGRVSADPDRPLSLHVRMTVQARDEKGNDVMLQAERKFLPPARIWTRVDEDLSGVVTVRAFDGETAWYRSNQNEQTVELVGPDFQSDRRMLRDDIDLMNLLTDVFFLDRLAGELVDLRRAPDDSGHGKSAYVLVGRGTHPSQGEELPVTLRLWIEKGTFRLYGARIEYDAADRPDLQLCFWDLERNANGILVPHTIKIFRDDDDRPSAELFVSEIDFDAGLGAEDFRPPDD
jgi:hypothetical protein